MIPAYPDLRQKDRIKLSIPTLCGLILGLGILWFFRWSAQSVYANPSTLFVFANGSGTTCSQTQPCSLTTALNQAADGDQIILSRGRYTGGGGAVITITRNLSLYGGWDGTSQVPFVRNPKVYISIVDGEKERRGIFAAQGIQAEIDGIEVRFGSHASIGAGMYARLSDITLREMTFFSNVVAGPLNSLGGGAAFEGGTIRIETSRFENNANLGITDDSKGGGLVISGTNSAIITGCVFTENDGWVASGIYFEGQPYELRTLELINNAFIDNGKGSSGAGSGGFSGIGEIGFSHAVVSGNSFRGNYAIVERGGLFVWGSQLELTRNLFWKQESGGISALQLLLVNPFTVTNNIIAGNTNLLAGNIPIIRIGYSRGSIVHNTLVGNGSDTGLLITNGSVVTITHSIVAGFSDGITITNLSTVSLGTNLWGSGEWSNNRDYIGNTTEISSSTQIHGNPLFSNAQQGDFHITAASPAHDAVTQGYIPVDIDGQFRPNELAYDLGADEYYQQVIPINPIILLPLIRR